MFTLNDDLQIPDREIELSFVRSSGPGGQNVNKSNTKVVLKWDLGANRSIPEPIRARLFKKLEKKINLRCEIVLSSDRYRNRNRNIEDCLEKFRQLLLKALRKPKKRVPTRVSKASKAKRLDQKKIRGEKKKLRGKVQTD